MVTINIRVEALFCLGVAGLIILNKDVIMGGG